MATALITGATAGIGASYTKLLASQGFDLVLVARDLPRLNKFAKELSKTYKIKVETIKVDLTKLNQLAKVEKRLSNKFLHKPIILEGSLMKNKSIKKKKTHRIEKKIVAPLKKQVNYIK